MSRRTLLLILAILAALAVSSLRLSIERRDSSPGVGDFPSARRSNRGPVPASLPLPVVVGLVAPSVQVRRRAKQAKHREPPRALRQYRAPAWFPARRSPRRYGLPRQRWPQPTPTAHERCESAAVVRPHLRSASRLWAGWRPIRCHKPKMPVTARVNRRFFRRYQGGEYAVLLLAETPSFRLKAALPPCQGLRLGSFSSFSDGRESPDSRDFFDLEPRTPVARAPFRVPLAEISPRYVV